MTLLSHRTPRRRSPARSALVVALSGALSTFGGLGCGEGTKTPVSTRPTSVIERMTQSKVDRLDILLAIDNSRSMADKQEILALAVPDLVGGLVNPLCIDEFGAPTPLQPTGPLDPCPAGAKRRFDPLTDIHIGVISSSLGGHGADACPDVENNSCAGGANGSNNDKGHLLSRKDPCDASVLPTYQGKGFLAWDPEQKLTPPGEASVPALASSLKDMVLGVGQIGCGYEATLESWYRFLVDPEPYASISVIDDKATPVGVDDALLAQRAEFLRSDSLLMIVMLSDENDCSMMETGQAFLAAQLKDENGASFHLPRARAECAINPNDPCCKSCGQPADGCPADPSCVDGNGNTKSLTQAEDPSNLRCYDQKRRFGIDFLHPIERYKQALESPTVQNRAGDLVPNPLFSGASPSCELRGVRSPNSVLLTAIVGVPWQDIARDKDDLTKGFKSADEMFVKDASGLSTWDVVLGDPAKYIQPKDPLMIEQIDPRTGTNPITGDAIADPSSPNGTNPINGHEYTSSMARDDLQYACIFPLPAPRDCLAPGALSCDCKDGKNDNPLCEPTDPANPTTTRTIQASAKAYPGLRELATIRALGGQATAASVCPKQLNDSSAADFGYRPAIQGIIDRLSTVADGSCAPWSLDPSSSGQVSCVMVEALTVCDGGAAACNACTGPGRRPVSADHAGIVEAAKKDPIYAATQWDCFCEIDQASGADLEACQGDASPVPVNMESGQAVNAWCYIDAMVTPAVGNPEIVKACPDNEKRLIRFVGEGAPKNRSTLFFACTGG